MTQVIEAITLSAGFDSNFMKSQRNGFCPSALGAVLKTDGIG